MKAWLKTFTLLVTFVLPLALSAQNQRYPAMRERILNARYNEICVRMKLEREKAEQLRPVFMKYEKEKSGLFAEKQWQRVPPDSTMTDEQAEEKYLAQLAKAKKLIEIREKYYREFRTVLSPKQVVQFHRVEMEVNRKMMQQLKKRMKSPANEY
jgi:hypothetical protein